MCIYTLIFTKKGEKQLFACFIQMAVFYLHFNLKDNKQEEQDSFANTNGKNIYIRNMKNKISIQVVCFVRSNGE